MQARGEKPPSRIIDFDALSDRGGHRLAPKNKSLAWTNKSSDVGKATKGCLALPVTQSGRGRTVQRSALLTGPGQQTAGASFRPRDNPVSRIWVWRYVCPFVRNNHCSVCNCNRIGGFARDGGLAQHLAAVSLGPHSNLPHHRFALRFLRPLSITIFFPPFIAIIFALVALFRRCPCYCLNLFSCSSYNNTPYLNRPMLAAGSVSPSLRHVAGAL